MPQFIDDMFHEAGKFANEVMETVGEALDEALFGPFRSSSSSSSSQPSDQHYHCYPCRDEDCDRR